ncbi:Protein of unknown function (DUF726) [Geosmithia morbida]|uniref:DUF726-domain-containing protein n=1 Tax=Geosmithia morbida TaxID=1094350 RepID=A0A9P5D5I2_9HYPO|nr:Protein of unknown function (DUF726) [Geosmithia morbida]KAF4123815.1 Protein of unknown function (DUF726) [Geosmithia morbida]
MARGSRGAASEQIRRPIDLSGHISANERNSLTVLVTAITDRMDQQISDIFDSPPVAPDLRGEAYNWLLFSLTEHRPLPRNSKDTEKQYSNALKNKKAHEKCPVVEERSKGPQLQELKKEALASFLKWQGNLLQRIWDIDVRELPSSFQGPSGKPRGRGRGPPRLPSRHTDLALSTKYPPTPNALWTLPQERRKLFLHIVLLAALSLSEYSAHTHLLLVYLTSSLNMPLSFLYAEEGRLAEAMAQVALDMSPEELLRKAEEAKSSRRGRGNNSPAPTSLSPTLTAAGIGTPDGSFGLTKFVAANLLGPLAGGGKAMCNLFGMNPAKPTSKMMEVFSREIQEFAFVSVHSEAVTEYNDARQFGAGERRFRLVLAMSGWASEDKDMRKPWLCLGRQTENYVVRWDPITLLSLGSSLETVIKSTAWKGSQREISKKSIFACLIKSEWPESLLKISKLVDNPWSVGTVRSEKAGLVLADAIMRHKFQGDRSVSLVGYGLAGRAIYMCLMTLAERRCFGLVESVVLMGAPIPSESRVWLTLKSVVPGRLVNVYSEHDYLLGFLCRSSNTQFGIAGLQEIRGARGVENYHVGRMPEGHMGYETMAGKILKDIGWECLDRESVTGRGKQGKVSGPRW